MIPFVKNLCEQKRSLSKCIEIYPKTIWWKSVGCWMWSGTSSVLRLLSLCIIILNSIFDSAIVSLIKCSSFLLSFAWFCRKSFVVWFCFDVQHNPCVWLSPGKSHSFGCLGIFKWAGHCMAGTHEASLGHASHFWNDVTERETRAIKNNRKANGMLKWLTIPCGTLTFDLRWDEAMRIFLIDVVADTCCFVILFHILLVGNFPSDGCGPRGWDKNT